jgi:hypothetical protein
MRKITDIYEEYKIMPNLKMHQLRVAAVAKQICESLSLDIDKDVFIRVCLLHDMGNIIKSKLDYFPEFLQPEGIEYWQDIKDSFIEKYGSDEHEATIKIIKELGLEDRVVELAGENRFSYMCTHLKGEDFMQKLIHYADGRVGPHGILSFDERMQDAGKRYENHSLSIDKKEHDRLVDCGKDIEKQIFAHSKIKPEDITDESVAGIIEELKNFEI